MRERFYVEVHKVAPHYTRYFVVDGASDRVVREEPDEDSARYERERMEAGEQGRLFA